MKRNLLVLCCLFGCCAFPLTAQTPATPNYMEGGGAVWNVGGTLNVTGTLAVSSSATTTFAGTVTLAGATALGDAAGDAITVAGTATFAEAATFTKGAQVAAVARTATTDGTTTGTIAAGTSWVTVTSSNAAHIVVLPAPTVGTIIHLYVGANGYELKSSAPATVAINGGTGASVSSTVGSGVLVTCRCTSATTWVCSQYAADGTESKLEAAH